MVETSPLTLTLTSDLNPFALCKLIIIIDSLYEVLCKHCMLWAYITRGTSKVTMAIAHAPWYKDT